MSDENDKPAAAVVIVLRSEGKHASDMTMRLRLALKRLLRDYGLRAVDVRPHVEKPAEERR